MGSVLCEHCSAACCRYVAIEIDKPTSARDYDDIRWYLMHEGVVIFVEEGDWFVQFRTKCKNLRADNMCGVYETRPQICRDYKAEDCDYCDVEQNYEEFFTHAKQVEAYYTKRTGKVLGAPKPLRSRLTKKVRKHGKSKLSTV